MEAIRVGGFVYGDFTMSIAEFKRRAQGGIVRSVTIKLNSGGWQYTHVGVVPEINGDTVRFVCDETTIFAKRRIEP